jgi:arylsulfatase A-like enzyme
MTGRYSLRTGVYDTHNGGAIMATEEITVAELLRDAGYATGIFGKWHLGDVYPFRPQDQGFTESLIHLSGGMGQVGDVYNYFEYDRS